MPRLYLYFLLCLFPCSPLFSSDSLLINQKLTGLESAKDTQRLRLLGELSWLLRKSDNVKAQGFAREGMSLALEMGDTFQYHKQQAKLGEILAIKGKYKDGIRHLGDALKFAQENKVKVEEAKYLNALGYAHAYQGTYQKSDSLLVLASEIKAIGENERVINWLNRGINFLFWKKYAEAKSAFKKGLECAKKIGDQPRMASFYVNIGIVEADQDNYLEAVSYYFKAVELITDEAKKGNVYNNIGNVYNRLGEWEKALDYHHKALSIREKHGLDRYIFSSLKNIGVVHKNQMNYGEAIKYYERALEINDRLEGQNNKREKLLNNIGVVYLHLQDYPKAESYFRTSIEVCEAAQNDYDKSRALANLANTFKQAGQHRKAIQYGEEAFELAQSIPFLSIIEQSSFTLSECHETLGHHEVALRYHKTYIATRDSILNTSNMLKINTIEKKAQFAQKEAELNLQKEKNQNLLTRHRLDRLQLVILGMGLVILALASAVLFLRNKKVKHRLATAQEVARLEKELFKEKFAQQRVELDNYLKQLLAKTEMLSALKSAVRNINATDTNGKNTVNMPSFLEQHLRTEKDWDDFTHYFTQVHKDFFKKLNTAFPNLTTNDLNLCALIKLNLNNKEVAKILAISPNSVKKARQRLYQKMNLPDNEALRSYILKI